MNTTTIDLDEAFVEQDAHDGAKYISWALQATGWVITAVATWAVSGFWLSLLAFILAVIATYYAYMKAAIYIDEHVTPAQKAKVGFAVNNASNTLNPMKWFTRK
jgi:Ca2+-dependent lipid-binding protein